MDPVALDNELAYFRKQVRQRPRDPVALHNLGVALARTGRLDMALRQFDTALSINPAYAPSLYAKGQALLRAGHIDGAIACLKGATAASDYAADAWLALGDAYRRARRIDAAAAAYQQHLALMPRSLAGYVNLGQMLGAAPEQAIAVLERGLAVLPDQPILHGLRGQTLLKLRRYRDAIDALRRALALAPDMWAAQGDLLRACREIADWDGEAETLGRFRQALPGLAGGDHLPIGLQNALFFDLSGPELRRIAAMEAAWRSRGITAMPAGKPVPRAPDAPLRIGYISPDFRNHPMMHLICDVFAAHDRAAVHVTAYSLTPVAADEWTERARQGVDSYVDLNGLDDAAAAARVRQDRIDILVDIAVYTQFCRPGILARRPAPVQIAWVGTPGSPSAPWIDYMMVDRVTAPPEQRDHFGEALIYLPKTYLPGIAWKALPPPPARAALGLPDQAFVFCCMNGHRKIDRMSFTAWMRILAAVPHSILWLLDLPAETAAALRTHAAVSGVSPDRLVVAPWVGRDEHLQRLAAADIALDTLVYGAHTTAADALRSGVPMVTVAGQRFAARVAASLLSAIDLPDLVAENVDSYCDIAIRLGRDPGQAAALSNRLRATAPDSDLFRPAFFAAAVERAFRMAWQRHDSGLPPADFDVPAGDVRP